MKITTCKVNKFDKYTCSTNIARSPSTLNRENSLCSLKKLKAESPWFVEIEFAIDSRTDQLASVNAAYFFHMHLFTCGKPGLGNVKVGHVSNEGITFSLVRMPYLLGEPSYSAIGRLPMTCGTATASLLVSELLLSSSSFDSILLFKVNLDS